MLRTAPQRLLHSGVPTICNAPDGVLFSNETDRRHRALVNGKTADGAVLLHPQLHGRDSAIIVLQLLLTQVTAADRQYRCPSKL